MSYITTTILSFSVVFGAIIGLLRYNRMEDDYKPLVWLLTAGLLSEIASLIIEQFGYSNSAVHNIFSLFEALIILWLFHQWKTAVWLSKHIRPILVFIVCFWLVENFIISSLQYFNSFFLVAYSFAIVILSIKGLNTAIWEERENLLRSAKFMIGLALLSYFTFSIIVEMFWMHGLDRYPVFQRNVYHILLIVNVIANLIYAFALLWTPTKPKFLLPSSSLAH